MQDLESFLRHDDERREWPAAGLLTIPAVAVEHENRLGRGFVANRAASASAGEGCGCHILFGNGLIGFDASTRLPGARLFQRFARFEQTLEAGEDDRPAIGDPDDAIIPTSGCRQDWRTVSPGKSLSIQWFSPKHRQLVGRKIFHRGQ